MASQATLNLLDLLIAAVNPNGHVDMSAIAAARAELSPCECGDVADALDLAVEVSPSGDYFPPAESFAPLPAAEVEGHQVSTAGDDDGNVYSDGDDQDDNGDGLPPPLPPAA